MIGNSIIAKDAGQHTIQTASRACSNKLIESKNLLLANKMHVTQKRLTSVLYLNVIISNLQIN